MLAWVTAEDTRLACGGTVPEQSSVFVTTPIYYVNGLPHIGHAYTTILADAYARWHRICGSNVFFLTGTDEHGQKVMQTAEKRGLSAQAHVDDLVVHWKEMWERLDIAYDRFIRTTEQDHKSRVAAVLSDFWDRGLIEKRDYEGWYHVGDEIFVTDKDVEAGKYDPSELQRLTESNYWFKMSNYQQQLLDHIAEKPDFIVPESRKNEVLGFLRQPLGDLCISRPKARMAWGIELPFDEEYVCYVWFDALLNYLTGVGYHPDAGQAGDWQQWWPATAQLLGKDILTTHSVYWSTMLMAMGVPLADRLYAHGWWTSDEGAKMSKSKGNAIDISLLVNEFGSDATRYFFLSEKSLGADGSFSYQGFLTRRNSDLANDLGNLAHRALSMTTNWLGGVVPEYQSVTEAEQDVRAVAAKSLAQCRAAFDEMDFHQGIPAVLALVRAGNKYVDTQQPWALNKQGNTERLQTVLRTTLEICFQAAACLLPVIPEKATELLEKLGAGRAAGEAFVKRGVMDPASVTTWLAALDPGAQLNQGDPLFPRMKELPEAISSLFDQEAPPPAPTKAKKKKARRPEPAPEITYEEFSRLNLRVGVVVSAEKHPEADRLLVLQVDIGEASHRQVVAGLATAFAAEDLVGKRVVVVANLAPAMLRGVQSQGMILAAGEKAVVDLITVNAEPGEVVR